MVTDDTDRFVMRLLVEAEGGSFGMFIKRVIQRHGVGNIDIIEAHICDVKITIEIFKFEGATTVCYICEVG